MFEQVFRNIDEILRKQAGCTTELDYPEQSSWFLFLKYLDEPEQNKADEAAVDAGSAEVLAGIGNAPSSQNPVLASSHNSHKIPPTGGRS